ncbi:conjugal transfer protein TraH [Massilia sp. TS11]|uniref:conjugal transfer protein TraH n=1 Tax=Massilia sp. TS11 TaxID=2908003 RepID=UPI001EDB365E|nr:conjugal transfer protein TraH [Massilia sp. TS11]MCG2583878.1 conjugal transfer protein TraH [Massilia sp. TS11]
MKTKLLAALVAAIFMPISIRAGDLNSEVNSMFNNLGAIGNYTAPGAFRGQAFNTYTGGSLMLRSQNKTYQLMAIDYPTAKAGCGGIDVYGGSFSHISSNELKNMLRNITSALPGVAFQLALDTVSPLLGGVTKDFNYLSTLVNNARINSCETAKGLVASAAERVGFNSQEACADVAITLGLETDRDAARRRCGSDRDGVMNAALNSNNPEAKARAGFTGNLTWAALKLAGNSLDDEERELVMSMLGTVVYTTPHTDGINIPPTLDSVKQLLYGQSELTGGNIELPLLRCDEHVNCMNVTVKSYSHTPITKKVVDLMTSITQKIIDRQPIQNNSKEIGFVNQTTEPVYKLLSIASTRPGAKIHDGLINQYKDVIATDYAYVFLDRNIRIGMQALEKDYQLDEFQRDTAAKVRARAAGLLTRIAEEKQIMYAKANSMNTMALALEQLDRQLRAGLPQQILDVLGRRSSYMR